MARRSDPVRIDHARRAAIRSRLTGPGLDGETADRWLDAWEVEATRRELIRDRDFWQTGAAWIAAERAARPWRSCRTESPAPPGST